MTDSPSADFNMVYQNNGPGIHIGNSSSLFVQSAKIFGNSGDGVHMQFDSKWFHNPKSGSMARHTKSEKAEPASGG